MTKQQSTTTADTDEYPVTKEDLLDHYTRTEDVIEEFRKINDATGITRETYDYFAKLDQFGKPERVKRAPISDTVLRYEEPSYKQVKHLRWLANVTNRDGTFRTPQDLVNDHSITPQELELFNGGNKDKSLPRREITMLKRHKLTDGTEWITRTERWYGLTKSCAIQTCPVDLGWYYYPLHENEFVQTDPNNPNSPTTRIIKLKYGPGGSFVGEPRYTDPYTPEKIKFYQKQLQLQGQRQQLGIDYSFILVREGHSNPQTVTDPIKFAEMPFDELWKELTSPKTNTVQFNPSDFEAYKEFLEYKRAMEKGKEKNSKDKEDAYR